MINGITEIAGRIGFAPVLTRIPALGFWGIWVTTGITWTVTAIVCVLRYKSGIWRRKGVVS
jgi:Na+-driven multidrug efflux pump